MKLEGSLTVFPLTELVEMIVYSSVTGALNIYSTAVEGHLFFRDGQPYHALCSSKTGHDGLVALFLLDGANFAFVSDSTTDEDTLWGDPFGIIETAAHQAERWQNILPRLPSSGLVPQLVKPLAQAQYQISPDHWELLQAVDGTQSAAELAALIGWELLDTCEAIAQMADDAVVALRPAPSSLPSVKPTPRVAQTEPPPTKPATGLFDRLMVNASSRVPWAPSPSGLSLLPKDKDTEPRLLWPSIQPLQY